MTRAEWESLCDGCGKCCVHKLEDEDTGELMPTNVSCRLLNRRTGLCSDYKHRQAYVPECVRLTAENLRKIDRIPSTSAYPLLANGEDLPDWHPTVGSEERRVGKVGGMQCMIGGLRVN